MSWAPWAVIGWAVLYGALRVYWAAGHAPRFAPMPDDLTIAGWGAVGLCLAAIAAAIAVLAWRRSVAVLVGVWAVVAAIAVACPLFLLDVVGGLFVGLGIPLNLVSAASRAGMLALAVLLAVSARAYRRRLAGACPGCGRTGQRRFGETTPNWAVAAAYAAVAGCLVRIVAQLVAGFEAFTLHGGPALYLFEAGFLAAGVLLPTALVHRFGRIWPRWVLPLAGRAVPRWLVLGPGFFIGGALMVYFGFILGQLTIEAIAGVTSDSGYDPWFYWVAVSGYWVWGVGVFVASIARFSATRPPCKTCGC